ncbi:putative Phosphatidylinositol 4-kinase stt4 [Paratrimastix pyriformis]|uniref:Phosphatidylinositol 4-kinase stt4 n=1 Tax=Paratrimastix pyriformis TaxID=342808 RepID=A0ABQ8ULB6_9EUKA|nr:putative Phosphatidylinositol 4-kinase stt4 [Paratrimastix pyriformis]
MVSFFVRPREAVPRPLPPPGPAQQQQLIRSTCIFKAGDDCRQDALALQLIGIMAEIFEEDGLPLFLDPYQVIPTGGGVCHRDIIPMRIWPWNGIRLGCRGRRVQEGIIEVVPHTYSRDQLGKRFPGNLNQHFRAMYGDQTEAFRMVRATPARPPCPCIATRLQSLTTAAQRNFITSGAAYSLAAYLLHIKDRHNGNILIDDAGHIVHIDFGFIFDINPGNVEFERAPFKLNTEMLELMGVAAPAQPPAPQQPAPAEAPPPPAPAAAPRVSEALCGSPAQPEPFGWFVELCCRGFLSLRQQMERLVAPVSLMVQSGLPCFKPESLQRLVNRFDPDASETDANSFMMLRVDESRNSYSTGVYDTFQYIQNRISW